MKEANVSPKKSSRLNGKVNGQVAVPVSTSPQTQKQLLALKKYPWYLSWTPWLLNTTARLLSWFVIINIIFRCPTDLESCTKTSPTICAPYFQLKATVTPYVIPVYETYAEPYIEVARPYYDTANTRFLSPAYNYVLHYTTPRFEQVQEIGLSHWEKSVQPQLDRYQARACCLYDGIVAPHVQKAQQAAGPYIDAFKITAIRTYHEAVLPAYAFSHPYALSGYNVFAGFATNTVIPTLKWIWVKACTFLDGTVWPHLRTLYMENVEPQLLRIGERLGRNRYDRSVQAPSPTRSAFSKTTPCVFKASSPLTHTIDPEPWTASFAAFVESSTASQAPETKDTETVNLPEDEDDEDFTMDTRPVRVIVADDLDKWESRYTQAAEDGVRVIIERVDEITKRMIADDTKIQGDRLLFQLKDSVEAELRNLRKEIPKLIANAVDEEHGHADVGAAVRKSGLVIKEKAQDLRIWRQQFAENLEERVNKAAQSNVQILEEIRDLALQKIGMKWAWMDGVTYKDWQNFHDLRSRLTGWTQEVKNLVVTHPGIEDAQTSASEIEDAAMEVAQAAARKLATLKQVGLWKVSVGDTSEILDPSVMEADIPDHYMTDHQATTAQQNNIFPAGGPEFENKFRNVRTRDTETPVGHGVINLKSIYDTIELPSFAQEKSAEVIDTSPTIHGTLSEAKVSEHIATKEDKFVPESADKTKERGSQDNAKPVPFGVAARSVADNQPILDYDSDALAGFTDLAQAAYSTAVAQASAQYSTALSIASAMMYGAPTPKPVHERLFSDVSSSYTAAVAAASSQLGFTLKAASNGVHGTPTTTGLMPVDWARVEAIAMQNLNEGRAWAEMQYSSAKIVLGLATPTPAAPVDKLLKQAKHNYYAGLGVAQARYQEFLAAAASTLSSTTATSTPINIASTASSLANVASESAVSIASAAGQGVGTVASRANSLAAIAGDSINSAIADVEAQAVDMVSAITDAWDVVIDQLSMQVYGEPTQLPWYGYMYEDALPYAADATDKMGEGVSAVTEVAGVASGQVERQYSAISSLISELVVGKEPTFSESVMSRLGDAYSTASSMVGSAASRATAAVKQEKDEL